jgi:hypothetical protein
VLVAARADASPVHVPYTGELVENGTSLTGWHLIAVSLWDSPTGGTAVHTQAGSLLLEQGIFHADLLVDGAVFAAHDSLWVGVGVDGAAELEPRVRIGVVPYAVRALAEPATPAAPGIAFATDFPSVDLSALMIWQAIATVSLNAPADGQVWLNASGWWQERLNTFPNYVSVEFVVGEGSPPPYYQNQNYYGFFEFRAWPFSHATVVPATAGPHTYTCWVRATSPDQALSTMPTFHPATMQALWVPGSYGN